MSLPNYPLVQNVPTPFPGWQSISFCGLFKPGHSFTKNLKASGGMFSPVVPCFSKDFLMLSVCSSVNHLQPSDPVLIALEKILQNTGNNCRKLPPILRCFMQLGPWFQTLVLLHLCVSFLLNNILQFYDIFFYAGVDSHLLNNVQFLKKSIPTTWKVIRNSLGEGGLDKTGISWGGGGEGWCKTKKPSVGR